MENIYKICKQHKKAGMTVLTGNKNRFQVKKEKGKFQNDKRVISTVRHNKYKYMCVTNSRASK